MTTTKAQIGLFLAGTVGVIIFLANFSDDGNKIEIGSKRASACAKGEDDCLPDVKYVDTTGKAYTVGDLAGKVVVVNFWATWCHPCQEEIPSLSRVYAKYKDRVVVFLGIMADQNPPSDDQLKQFESEYSLTYPVVRVNSDILTSFNYPDALPTTFVFNKSGKQVYKQLGGIDEDQLSELLDQYVAEK